MSSLASPSDSESSDIPATDADTEAEPESREDMMMSTGTDESMTKSGESVPSSAGLDLPVFDSESSVDETEEKARLIAQVMELQNTLDDISQRVDSVKEENLKLKSENQVLGQYIENLMSASSVFQSTSPKSKKK